MKTDLLSHISYRAHAGNFVRQPKEPRENPLSPPPPKPYYDFDPADPFEGKKIFESYEAAILQAMLHIRAAMKANGSWLEYGVEVDCKEASYMLGKRISGGKDEKGRDVVKYVYSIVRKSDPASPYYLMQPGGHSHSKYDRLMLSDLDFGWLAKTEPLDGKKYMAIFDYSSSQVLIAAMQKDLDPPFSVGAKKFEEMKQFIEKNRGNRNITISRYELDDHGATLICNPCNDRKKYFQDTHIKYSERLVKEKGKIIGKVIEEKRGERKDF